MQPSPNGRRVGIRIVTFEACSGFTHVTAHRIAQPPKATFVTRLQLNQLPDRAARQLPDQSTTLWVESSSTDSSRLRGARPSGDTHGLFIDGGVTPYNNPAHFLLMLATLKQFGICWKLGPKDMTIVSIGTGSFRPKLSFGDLANPLMRQLNLVERTILSCIADGQNQTLAQMQWLGDCPVRWPVNSEIFGVEGNPPPGGPWFRFMRYDVGLDPTWMLEKLGRKVDGREASQLQRMDSGEAIETLFEIGTRAANMQVKPEHLFGGAN